MSGAKGVAGEMMENLINIRRSCVDNVDFLGGDSQNSKQIDAIMGTSASLFR